MEQVIWYFGDGAPKDQGEKGVNSRRLHSKIRVFFGLGFAFFIAGNNTTKIRVNMAEYSDEVDVRFYSRFNTLLRLWLRCGWPWWIQIVPGFIEIFNFETWGLACDIQLRDLGVGVRWNGYTVIKCIRCRNGFYVFKCRADVMTSSG